MPLTLSEKTTLLNKMNSTSIKVGLGDLVTSALGLGSILAIGKHTTTAASTNAIAVAGMLASDVPFVVVHTVGGTPRTVLTTAAASGQINVTFSGDPSTDHVVSYIVFRPA